MSPPNSLTASPVDFTTVDHTDVELTCHVVAGVDTVIFQKDGADVVTTTEPDQTLSRTISVTNTRLTFSQFKVTDAGSYTCKAVSGGGVSRPSPAVLLPGV